jgi:hypothetical protein
MAEYNTFKYIPELPVGMPVSDWAGTMLYTWSDRSDITAGVVMLKDGVFESIWSVHSRLPLAEARAKKYAKENTIAGRAFIAVPLNLQPRNKTYFSGSSFGNAEEMLVLDTSEWSMEMWNKLRYNANTIELAKHFAEGVHEFEERKTWRGSKSLSLPICKTCYLLREELYA